MIYKAIRHSVLLQYWNTNSPHLPFKVNHIFKQDAIFNHGVIVVVCKEVFDTVWRFIAATFVKADWTGYIAGAYYHTGVLAGVVVQQEVDLFRVLTIILIFRLIYLIPSHTPDKETIAPPAHKVQIEIVHKTGRSIRHLIFR